MNSVGAASAELESGRDWMWVSPSFPSCGGVGAAPNQTRPADCAARSLVARFGYSMTVQRRVPLYLATSESQIMNFIFLFKKKS